MRLAFVCSMWTTGFDVPSLSTVYLDKPLRNHTLMQTITRANRVFPEKNNGLIVAYVDVFRNLQKALAIYAIGGKAGAVPVEEKGALVDALRRLSMSSARSVPAAKSTWTHSASSRASRWSLPVSATVEMLMVDDEEKVALPVPGALVDRLYKAILPDTRANEFSRVRRAVTKFLADAIAAYTERPDVSGVMGRSRAAARRVGRRQRVPDPRRARPMPCSTSRQSTGMVSRRHSSRAARVQPRSGCVRCSRRGSRHSSASTPCASIWSSGSRSWSPTTTPAA